MLRYAARRVLQVIPVLLGVTVIVFFLMRMAGGDAASAILGEDADSASIEALREQLGLDRPLIGQYFSYLGGVLKGDLGTSYVTGRNVTTEIMERFPTTITLAGLSVVIAGALGIVLGSISATHQYSLLDKAITILSLAGISMPVFWLGLIMLLQFGLKWRIFPTSFDGTAAAWVLPALTVGCRSAALIARQMRSSMLEVINQDYIRTARAKGQSGIFVVGVHAMKNALIPIVTLLGIQFGHGLGGAVVTETVFSIPGLGKLMVDAIGTRNFPIVQGGAIVIATAFSLINLAVDLLYAALDPSIRDRYRSGR